MRTRPLSLLVKPASADCNLACEYCFYLPKSALYPETPRHRMPEPVLERLMSEYMPLAYPEASLVWQGGEPTLMGLDFFRRAAELEQRYGRPGQTVANGLQTNGLLINDDWAAFLAHYNFLVGLSLDGPPHVHDHYRRTRGGRPSFEQVMRAQKVLHRGGVEHNFLVMVTPVSAPRAAEIYRFFVGRGFRYLQVIPCVEYVADTRQPEPYTVSAADYGRFMCDLFDLWADGDWRKVFVRDFNDFLSVYMGRVMPTCIHRQRCGDYVVIEYNGDVYPCDFFVEPELKLGNIMDRPLAEIVEDSLFAEFCDHKSDYAPECTRCEWLWLCYGACPKHRLVATGSWSGHNHLCAGYRVFFEHADERFRAMAEELQREGGRSGRVGVAAVGRNDPCPCGSGRKYKKCCMR